MCRRATRSVLWFCPGARPPCLDREVTLSATAVSSVESFLPAYRLRSRSLYEYPFCMTWISSRLVFTSSYKLPALASAGLFGTRRSSGRSEFPIYTYIVSPELTSHLERILPTQRRLALPAAAHRRDHGAQSDPESHPDDFSPTSGLAFPRPGPGGSSSLCRAVCQVPRRLWLRALARPRTASSGCRWLSADLAWACDFHTTRRAQRQGGLVSAKGGGRGRLLGLVAETVRGRCGGFVRALRGGFGGSCGRGGDAAATLRATGGVLRCCKEILDCFPKIVFVETVSLVDVCNKGGNRHGLALGLLDIRDEELGDAVALALGELVEEEVLTVGEHGVIQLRGDKSHHSCGGPVWRPWPRTWLAQRQVSARPCCWPNEKALSCSSPF